MTKRTTTGRAGLVPVRMLPDLDGSEMPFVERLRISVLFKPSGIPADGAPFERARRCFRRSPGDVRSRCRHLVRPGHAVGTNAIVAAFGFALNEWKSAMQQPSRASSRRGRVHRLAVRSDRQRQHIGSNAARSDSTQHCSDRGFEQASSGAAAAYRAAFEQSAGRVSDPRKFRSGRTGLSGGMAMDEHGAFYPAEFFVEVLSRLDQQWAADPRPSRTRSGAISSDAGRRAASGVSRKGYRMPSEARHTP